MRAPRHCFAIGWMLVWGVWASSAVAQQQSLSSDESHPRPQKTVEFTGEPENDSPAVTDLKATAERVSQDAQSAAKWAKAARDAAASAATSASIAEDAARAVSEGVKSQGQASKAAGAVTAGPTRRIHTLLYTNANDGQPGGGIGPGAQANRKFLNTVLDVECAGQRVAAVDRFDRTFNRNQVLADIARLDVQPTDAVFCYISTHGAFFQDRNGQLDFQMSTFGTNVVSLRRREVMDAIRMKKPQLTILISDSCGSIIRAGMGAPAVGLATPVQTHPLYHLLFGTTGEISINAAMPGPEAVYLVSSGPDGGGMFTRAFCQKAVFGKVGDWKTFFNEVAAESVRSGANISPRQPPPCLFNANGDPVDVNGKLLR